MVFGVKPETGVVVKRLLQYVRPYRLVLIPAGLAIVVYALVTSYVPLFMENVFEEIRDGILTSVEDSEGLLGKLWLPSLIVVAFAIRGAMDFLTVYGLTWVGRSAIRDLRTDLFRRYLYLPASFYDRNASGDLISRLTFNIEQLAEAISTAIVVVVRDALLIIFMIIVMITMNAELTVVLVFVGPVVALLLGAMSRAFRRYSVRIQSSMGDVTRVVGQALQGQRIVKLFSGQEYETRRFDEINQRNFRLHLRLIAARAFGDATTQLVVVFGVACIVFFVLSGLLSEEFDTPEFMGFITAVGILLTALKRLVSTNAIWQRGIAAGFSLFEILDEPAESGGGTIRVKRVEGEIEFARVSFRYGYDEDEVLSDVSFRVEPGNTLAIVGRSGSGKSTLVSMLPRFYDVTAGVIRLDGKDIRDYPLQSLRDQFSFVSQDVILFDDTIAGNIAYGSLAGSTREAIEQAAEAAYVTGFAEDLPDGLDSEVGEGGALLSGGQRQRIAIARALLKDAPILILDEATSSLDSESEQQVQSALGSLMQGRTTLIIAHRLATVEKADRIIVMHEGRIVESGTHVELLAAAGYYSNLYRLQFAE